MSLCESRSAVQKLAVPTYTDGQVLQQPLVSGQLVLQVVHGDAGAAVLTDGNIELVQGISTFQNTARAWPVLNNSILGIKINFNLRAAGEK